MAIELAKAYVQIVPSAEGIQGSITGLLGGEASSAGDSAGAVLGSRMVSTIKKVLGGAAIGKFVSESIRSGADLEQSIGGIETLFKDSAGAVKEAAANAYKTAGLSANDYMEQTTSFAASLLQSLGNNTRAAADVAQMAMTDMSDNANKMGTDMQSKHFRLVELVTKMFRSDELCSAGRQIAKLSTTFLDGDAVLPTLHSPRTGRRPSS